MSKYALPTLLSAATSLPLLGHKQLSKKVDIVHATDYLIANLGTYIDGCDPAFAFAMGDYKYRELKSAVWCRAPHILIISALSTAEIMTHFGISDNKITVTPLAVDEQWFANVSVEARADVKKILMLSCLYMVSPISISIIFTFFTGLG